MNKRIKKLLVLLLTAVVLLQSFGGMTMTTVAEAATKGTIGDLYTDKAMYQPGENVVVTVELETSARRPAGVITLQGYHLNEAVGEPVSVSFSGKKTVTINWTAPVRDFQGYLLEAALYNENGTLLDTRAVGVNVSSTWVKFPIYGYLYDFGEHVDTEGLIEQMAKYHINGIEYYDWHYRHHEPLPATSTGANMGTWNDWAGRTIYGNTVKSYISAAKANGMASMAYDMIYAFTDDLLDKNPAANGWRIKFRGSGAYFNYDMNPYSNNKNDTLYFVNPLHTDWQTYFFAQLQRMIQETGFDGYHGDTVGDWGDMTDENGNPLGYDAQGNPIYVVADTYNQFLNACKDALGGAYLSFNPVGAKGIQNVNTSKTDVLYTEFWPWDSSRHGNDYSTYAAIAREVEDSMNDSKEMSIDGLGKSLVVKAYINYQCQGGTVNDPTALLLEAAAFAAGGSRLELGNGEHMLTNEYYPSDQVPMSETLKPRVRTMYDFAVAYENLLRDGQWTTDNKVALNRSSSKDAAANTIWTYTRSDGQHEILHLINLLGTDNQWRDVERTKAAPQAVNNLNVKYYYTKDISGVYLASPDQQDCKSNRLEFVKGEDADGRYVEFTVPSLEYWDMIYMSTEEEKPVLYSLTLEAEAGTLTAVHGTPVVGSASNASGSQYVHDIGLDQGYLTMTVPEEIPGGIYTLKLVYSSGMNGAMSVSIDGTEYVLDYTVTDYNWNFAGNTLRIGEVELYGGENIVVHDARGNCWSWLDCITLELNEEIITGPASGVFSLEMEQAVLTRNGGAPAVGTSDAASAGQYVHDIGLNQGYATVTVPEDAKKGTYRMTLGYSSGTNGEVSITVNGEETTAAYAMTDGSWNFASGTVTVEGIKLHGGDEIVIHDARNNCWIWADCLSFELMLPAAEDPNWGIFSLEAETATLRAAGGSPAVASAPAASGGQYVHDIGRYQGSAALALPGLTDDGLYTVELVYSSGTNGKVAVTVGGETYIAEYPMTSANWTFEPATIVIPNVRLHRGDEIVIQDAEGNCWIWVDRMDFRLTALE